MKRISASAGLAVSIAVATGFGAPAAADVQVGIHIGIPVPPPLIIAPPHLVVVPAVPAVRYAPGLAVDVFFYGGRYFAWNDGWFVAASLGQPWAYVEPAYVPAPILSVPASYCRGHRGGAYGHFSGGRGRHGAYYSDGPRPHRNPQIGWYAYGNGDHHRYEKGRKHKPKRRDRR